MKIKKIEGENFKGHENLELNLADKKIQVFVGKNGVGKSSAIEMIQYAITGVAPLEPINNKYNYMSVYTELESGDVYERSLQEGKPSKVRVNKKNTTGKSLNDLLTTITGVPAEHMKVVTSAEVVEHMKPSEFSDFIMGYAPEELDFDNIKSYAGCSSTEVEDELKKYFPEMPSKFSAGQIKESYKDVFDERKRLKTIVAEKKQGLKIFNGEIPKMSMSDIDAEIEKLLKEQVEFSKQEEWNRNYKKALASIEKQKEEEENLTKEIEAITVPKPLASKEKELKDEKWGYMQELAEMDTLMKNLEKNKKMYEELISDLNCEFCPLCADIKCTTDKASYKKDFEDNLESTKEGISILKSKREKMLANVKDVDKRMLDYAEQVNLYNKKISLVQQLNKVKSLTISLPAKPELKGEITDYSAKIAELKRSRIQIFEYEQNERLRLELNHYENLLNIYEELVSKLSPKGVVMDHIIEYYLSVFEDICNDFSDKLKKDFKVRFKAENGITIYGQTGKMKTPVRYESLSSGEKADVLFLILHMLNSLSGLKIMIMDDLDKLDADAFSALLELVTNPVVEDEYDHIILSCVDHEDSMKLLAKHPEIKVIKLS